MKARPYSNKRVFTFKLVYILLVLLLLFYDASANQPFELASLLERIRVEPPARVAFSEQRQNRLLKEPMVLGGHLAYLDAGHLQKVVETPFSETLSVEGDEIALSGNGRERRLSLRNRQSFRVMLQGIEAVMAGDVAVLEEHFEVALTGDEADWRIDLVPRSGRLAKRLQGMTVAGAGDRVQSIRFELADGEWQRLELLHDGAPDD